MVSNIETIRSKLHSLYPNLSSLIIDDIIAIYFEQARKDIKELKKPELGFMWSTLRIRPEFTKNSLDKINNVLKDPDRFGYTEKRMNLMLEKKVLLEKVLKDYNKTLEGRNIVGKRNRLKQRNETESNNTD